MNSFIPQFQAAAFSDNPQQELINKFGGYPWGLPTEKWCLCQVCKKPMSLLAQLCHTPPALVFLNADEVLHIFQCLECLGFESGIGNDALFLNVNELGNKLSEPPDEIEVIGELWISGWKNHSELIEYDSYSDVYDFEFWKQLPDEMIDELMESSYRTKMGGLPYWSSAGPGAVPKEGHEFLFQIDQFVHVDGSVIEDAESDFNAPWTTFNINEDGFQSEITNFGTDGTAYIFINRSDSASKAYWYWMR